MAQVPILLRNILIINKIKSTPYISRQALVDYVKQAFAERAIQDAGLSQRTIFRDIQQIQTNLSVDIQYSRAKGGYFIEPADIRLEIEQFLDSFDVFTALNAYVDIPEFVFAEKHRSRGTQYLFSLINAIKNCLTVTFEYQKFQGAEISKRCIEPYALKEFRGRWYLVGRTANRQEMKSYGIDRIKELVVTSKNFDKDLSINLSEKFKYSYGIYSSDEYPVQDVILSFDAEDGNYLKSLPLHHSQEIIEDSDKFVIKLRLKVTNDFVMEILSRSWSLEVIEPVSLREKVRKIYESALKRHKKRG